MAELKDGGQMFLLPTNEEIEEAMGVSAAAPAGPQRPYGGPDPDQAG